MRKPNQNLSSAEDEDLIILVAGGDKRAFAELTERNLKSIYSIAYRLRLSKTDAEDIAQETFLRLWQKAGLWNKNGGASVRTWLYRIAYNLCLDQKRKPQTVNLELVTEPADYTQAVDSALIDKELKQVVTKAVADLPKNQKTAIILCHYQKISNLDAAKIMQISVKAVESLLVRAKKTLRKTLQKNKGLLS